MAATMTTMPPTTHALPQAQRAHLIRSARKLGDLLGETPLLVESSTTAAQRSHSRSASSMSTTSRRSARIYMASPRTSSLGLATHAAAAPAPQAPTAPSRPMLFLNLPPAAATPTHAPAPTAAPLPSPLSPTFGLTLNSPTTPTPTPTPAPHDPSRRRKMAKLMRTLGENVPPELVFPTAAARRRASMPAVSMRDGRLPHARAHSPAASIPVQDEPDAPFSYPSTVPVQYEYHLEDEEEWQEPARRSTDTAAPGAYLLPRAAQGDGCMRRKEREWSGEWTGGASNMDDVMRSLRGLKMK
ncbi:hypothetical protein C8R46DRAFT_311169 [Mycena filopes]|nr:hypothetical protein C8R46DRAFT_311169 [Mycena filopes]